MGCETARTDRASRPRFGVHQLPVAEAASTGGQGGGVLLRTWGEGQPVDGVVLGAPQGGERVLVSGGGDVGGAGVGDWKADGVLQQRTSALAAGIPVACGVSYKCGVYPQNVSRNWPRKWFRFRGAGPGETVARIDPPSGFYHRRTTVYTISCSWIRSIAALILSAKLS